MTATTEFAPSSAAVAVGPLRRADARVTFAVVAAVLAWLGVQLARFLGEPPDLDAMVSLRESLVFHHDGLDGLVASAGDAGIHPPLLDLLSTVAFTLFGEEPRSQRLISVAVFVVLAVSVERLLAPRLRAGERFVGALAVAICPAIAIAVFLVSREGLMVALLAAALALALAPGGGERRLLTLGAVLALLPLVKETGLALVVPFAVHAALVGAHGRRTRCRRAALLLALPVISALAWRAVLALVGSKAWAAWVLSSHSDEGPYVAGLRAMFGFEPGIFQHQNLANALVVNFLWLPAVLAVTTIVLLARRPGADGLRPAMALVGGLAVIYAWTTLTFPTYTIPRYAVPLTFLTLVFVLLGLPLWPRRVRPLVPAALLVAFAAGSWSPCDPVSRGLFGTTSVAGERIYATDERNRGPDRVIFNFAVLRASDRINGRLRQVFASDATMVTGDCDAMKLGEKLYSIGLAPRAYASAFPGARSLACVPLDQLPPDAATGPQRIALVRTPEEEASRQPPPLAGPSVVHIR